MRARLALSRAVLHDPDLLLLDEPTAGLDPESARIVLGLIDEMAEQGKAVVMCTHLLLEAEGLADQVVVMDQGRVLVAGTADDLTRRYWPSVTVLVDAEDPAMLDRAAAFPFVRSYERNGSAMVELDDRERVADLVDTLVARRRPAAPGRAAHADARRALLHRPAGADEPRPACSPSPAADLRQLRESKDFWVPLAIIAVFMFVVVPAVMLYVISTVQDPTLLAKLVDVVGRLPAPLRVQARRRRARGPGVLHAGGLLLRAAGDAGPAHDLVVDQREHVRRRARARQRRVPRALPRVDHRHLSRQAHRRAHPRLHHRDRRRWSSTPRS